MAHVGVASLKAVGGMAEQHMRVGKPHHLVLRAPGVDDLPERGPVKRLGRQVGAIAFVAPGENRG